MGTDFAHSHMTLRTFMTEQQSPPINFYGPTQVGNHNTQNNTFGHDPNQLAQFARELLTAANNADITDTARARITDSVEVLEGELASADPEPGTIRRLFENAKQAALENLSALTVQTSSRTSAFPSGDPIPQHDEDMRGSSSSPEPVLPQTTPRAFENTLATFPGAPAPEGSIHPALPAG
ncbi:hypothetical protein ACVWZD_000900 [Streptomyces sp. TE3672]